MKKIFAITIFLLTTISCYAQDKVCLKKGTVVSIKITETLDSKQMSKKNGTAIVNAPDFVNASPKFKLVP